MYASVMFSRKVFLNLNGTRQGGVLLPQLFSRYIRDVIKKRLHFLIAINLTIKKLISVNLIFNNKILFQLPCGYEKIAKK